MLKTMYPQRSKVPEGEDRVGVMQFILLSISVVTQGPDL